MSAAPVEAQDSAAAMTIVRTRGGLGLHLPDCPHVHDCVVHDATSEELESVPLCGWSQAELDGVGRRYFATVEAAMRHFGSHAGTERRIRQHLRDVLYDQIWVPYSGSYIALGLGGAGVAWVGKSYVSFRDGRLETLPGYGSRGGGGTPAHQRYGDTCASCGLGMPLVGGCDFCS
jgi:hypothetical protein